MKQLEYAFSLALVLIGAGMVWEGYRLGYASFGIPGAGFFPIWSGLVLAASGAGFGIQSATSAPPGAEFSFRRQFLAIVLAAAFLVLNETVGTLGAIAIYLGGFVYFVGRHSLLTAVVCCAVSIGIIYAVFELWLRIPLMEAQGLEWLRRVGGL